jgi:hypothetical protein
MTSTTTRPSSSASTTTAVRTGSPRSDGLGALPSKTGAISVQDRQAGRRAAARFLLRHRTSVRRHVKKACDASMLPATAAVVHHRVRNSLQLVQTLRCKPRSRPTSTTAVVIFSYTTLVQLLCIGL